jgi:hypothetical protein
VGINRCIKAPSWIKVKVQLLLLSPIKHGAPFASFLEIPRFVDQSGLEKGSLVHVKVALEDPLLEVIRPNLLFRLGHLASWWLHDGDTLGAVMASGGRSASTIMTKTADADTTNARGTLGTSAEILRPVKSLGS